MDGAKDQESSDDDVTPVKLTHNFDEYKMRKLNLKGTFCTFQSPSGWRDTALVNYMGVVRL